MDAQDRTAAANVRLLILGQEVPKIDHVLGQVTAYSCKHIITDPPASCGDAIEQLQAQAAGLGANAIINVSTEARGKDMGSNCWESFQASGTAVALSK